MAINYAAISLFSAFVSMIAIFIVLSIFKKVYQEDYKKPWLYIGISTLVLALSQLSRFLNGFYSLKIINQDVTEFLIFVLDFIAIIILTYGLLLESLILKFYKGKFVKFKFVPVQEGTLGGELDINVSNGNAYLAIKKDRNFLLEQFSQATKKGFEGFLVGENSPKDIRSKYKIEKTPIAWITQIDNQDSTYIKNNIDEFSDIVDPIDVNNIITYVDNFLEQSESPFILIDLNLILKVNNFSVASEFLKYIASRIIKYDGILIYMINTDILEKSQIAELQSFLREFE